MKKTMMYLPEDLHRFLAEEAEARHISMAEVAREAISEYRAGKAPAKKQSVLTLVGILDDPNAPTDLAVRHDHYLDEYYKEGGLWDQEHGFAPVQEDEATPGTPEGDTAEQPT